MKLFKNILTLIILTFPLFFLSGCTTSESSKDNAGSDTLSIETISENRTFGIAENCFDSVRYSSIIDFPTDSTPLADTIRRYIANATATGSKLLVTDDEYMTCCETFHQFQKIFESKKIVTYNFISYYYLGGAHGSTIVTPYSFIKATNRAATWSIIKDTLSVIPLIEKGLYKYFNVSSDAELYDMLLLDNKQKIPFPTTNPSIVGDSITFLYQQYEIACYAAGMPSTNIAISDLKQYLSKEGEELFNR